MGLTKPRAYQIYDIDYKQSVRVITLTNITLSGGAPNQVDGVNLSLNDRVLVAGQSNTAQNGLYYVTTVGSGSNGAWQRSTDGNQTGEIESGMIVMVTEGTIWADTSWKLITNDPITIGVSGLVFEQNTGNAFGNINANGTSVTANTASSTLNLTAGTNISITGNNTSKTVTIGVTGISLNSISNGTSNVNVVSSGGNVTVGVGGTGNIAVFSSTGANIAGTLGVTGNITGGNLSGTGITGTLLTAAQTNITSVGTLGSLTVTANIAGGNLTTAGQVVATGNVSGGNLNITGNIVDTGALSLITGASGNINLAPNGTNTLIATTTGANVTGTLGVTGNITGGNLSGTSITGTLLTAAQTNITSVGTLGSLTVTANVAGGNLTTAGQVVATGNVSGGNINLTGNIVDTGALTVITGSSGNINLAPNGTNTLIATITGANITGTLNATGNANVGNIGATNVVATNLTGTLTTASQTNITSVGTLGSLTVTGNVSGGNLTTAGQVVATGNITGGNLLVNGSTVITGNLRVDGTETIFNVQTLSVNDKDIIVANNVSDGANVNGAGIQAGNPAVATWFFNNATTSWQSNIGITPTANGTLNLGGVSNYWGTAYLTVASVTGNITGGNIIANGRPLTSLNASNIDTGTLAQARLANSTFTLNGTTVTLGGTSTITANATAALTIGTGLGGTSYNGGTAVTITNTGVLSLANGGGITASASTGAITLGSTATSANTASAIVARDASGNFSAGTITATLSGAATTAGTVTTAAQPNITSVGTLSSVTVTGNVTGGNVTTAGQVAATGNITGGNLITAGQISATGTITTAAGTNSTGFAVGNGAVSNVGLGFFPTAGTRGDYAIRDYSNVTSTMYFDVGMGGSPVGEFQFRTSNAFTLLMRADSTGITTPGRVFALELNSTQSAGDEGGQINLARPVTNNTLAGNVIIDVFQNRVRFFENGGTNRGAFIDLTSCNASVGTNLLSGGGGGGTPGGSNTFVQFNDGGTFGGATGFTFDKTTNTLTANIIASTNNGAGTNFKVGDDAWIGDINTADTLSIRGQQNAANAYIIFGNANASALGRAGTGPLTYTGAFTATGNISGGNLSGTGITGTLLTAAQTNITSVGTLSSLTVTANVAGGNITTGGNVVATGNVSGGNLAAVTNIFSFGTIQGTGNVSGGNLTTAGQVVATGNVSGGNLNVTGNIVDTGAMSLITGASGNINLAPNGTNTLIATTTGANVTGTLTATGNVSGGNVTTAGQVTAVGNISGNFFIGNGSQLTGTTPNAIVNGTSNVSISSSGSNVTVSVAGTSNAAVFSAGVFSVNGLITTPKTISVSGNLPVNTNSQLIGPVTINNGVTIIVPDSSTLYITP